MATGEQATLIGRVPFGRAWPILFSCIVVLSLAALAFMVIVWRHGDWNRVGRVHYTLVTLAMWAFV